MSEPTDDIFAALASPVRRQILEDLREGELAAGDIASNFSFAAPTISRHLSVLRTAGLIEERREGTRIYYSLAGDRLAFTVNAFLSNVCPEQVLLRVMRGKPAKRDASFIQGETA